MMTPQHGQVGACSDQDSSQHTLALWATNLHLLLYNAVQHRTKWGGRASPKLPIKPTKNIDQNKAGPIMYSRRTLNPACETHAVQHETKRGRRQRQRPAPRCPCGCSGKWTTCTGSSAPWRCSATRRAMCSFPGTTQFQ